jgi:predicted small secreted protein
MRRALVIGVLTVGCALLGGGPSGASVLGPFCWTIPPFTDVLALSFITDGGNTAAVAGSDVSVNAAFTGGAFRESDGVTVNMVATIGQANLGMSAVLLQVRFSSVDRAGFGRCQAVNPDAGGCGFGTNISFAPVGCPVGAPEPHARALGPLAGGGD